MSTNSDSSREKSSIYRHMVRGSAWAVAMRWGIRAIGLVSVVILARLLSPEDFGIVAMGALTINFIGAITQFGVQMLLIREQDVGREDCDTAWTMKILQGVFIAIILFLIAPFAADYFDDGRVVKVLYVLAAGAVFDGIQNIGMVLARKELDFAKDFRFNVYVRIVGFVITITLAFLLRNYWALVIGQVLSSLLSIPLSYAMHNYRPRFSLAKAAHYLKFSASIIPLRIGRYLNSKVHVLVVGGLSGTSQLGIYNVASDVSAMLTQEILIPLGRGLMPSYAKLNHDPARLTEAFVHVLRVAAVVVLPVGLGLAAVAEDFVMLLLGNQWDRAIPLVEMLALYSMLVGLMHIMSNQILIVTGNERRSAILVWVRLAVLFPIIIFAGQLGGANGVARGAVLAAVVVVPLVIFVLTRSIPITIGTICGAFWRPLVAAVTMAGCVRWLAHEIALAPLFSFLVEVVVGACIYVAVLLLLWRVSGSPRGIERVALEFVASARDRRTP